jgi:hypothetical protein
VSAAMTARREATRVAPASCTGSCGTPYNRCTTQLRAGANRGRELLEAQPGQANLYDSVACCDGFGGPTHDAITHLLDAVAIWDGCRDAAKDDAGFDPIPNESAFVDLIED